MDLVTTKTGPKTIQVQFKAGTRFIGQVTLQTANNNENYWKEPVKTQGIQN